MTQRRQRSVQERPEWQCRYRGGECFNARAIKIDGSLHHLCQEHRLRANWNQRISQRRRRRLRRNQPPSQAAPAVRRRQTERADALRRIDYSEWLQILDSVEWPEPFMDPPTQPLSFSSPTSAAAWENDLFAPLASQLTDVPSDQDASISEAIYYLIASDASFQLPSLSEPSDEPITDINSDASHHS
jgi:hypothetical protein